MQSASPFRSEAEITFPVRGETEGFPRSSSDFAELAKLTSDVSDEVPDKQQLLGDHGLKTALSMLDTMLECIDAEKIKFAQLEVNYQLEICQLSEKLREYNRNIKDLFKAYSAVNDENNQLKNLLSGLEIVARELI